ncbi:MAG: C4-type zinc ribbon domain-containing protein [Candidatus Eisenbacteria bacterium]
MTEEIAVLVSLRIVDASVRSLRRAVGTIPEQIAELTRKIELLREEFAGRRARIEETKGKRRARERDTDDFSEKIRQFELKQFEVKTNKEYQARLHEIALLKEKRSHVEGEIIELMEQEESSTKEIREFEAKIATEEALAAEEKRKLEQRLEDARHQMKVVTEERESLLARLGHQVRSRYERIVGGKDGVAIALVRNRACGACFTNLPPQTVNEIRKGTQVILCETCGRILVWVDESGQ